MNRVAQRYERSEARRDTRAGHYERKLQTKAGEVRLRIPKLRQQTFETAIIERYRRRESSVEEALIEMYLAGVSVRRVEDITEALWGTRVSPSTVSELNKKIYGTIETWRNRPIEVEHPYVYLDGIVLKRSWAGEVRNVSLLVAIGVNSDGYREILGICEGAKEDKAGWSAFLKQRNAGYGASSSSSRTPVWGCPRVRPSSSQTRPGSVVSCTGTATSSVTFPRPRCERSRRCSRRFMPARTSWRHARRLSE
jgi:transposase-like protein